MSRKPSVHMPLMREMGAPSYDPTPPDQNLCFLDPEVKLTDRGHRGHAWLKSKTIHPDRNGKRWAWAHETGRGDKGDLRLQHMAQDLDIDQSAATKVWQELERVGIGRRDEKGRLRMCGTVQKQEGEEKEKPLCTDKYPDDLLHYLQSLDSDRRSQYKDDWIRIEEHGERMQREAIALARAQEQELKERWFAAIGFHRRKRKGATPKKRPKTVVQLKLNAYPDLSVQISKNGHDAHSVHNAVEAAYTNENGPVQKSASLSDFSKQSKVSESGGNVESDPAPGQEKVAANPTPRSTALGLNPRPSPPPAPLKPNPSVEGEGAAANAVTETFEAITGRPIPAKDPMRREIAELGRDHDLPQNTVCRFMKEKHTELKNRKFKFDNPGGFRNILKQDLPVWLNKEDPQVLEWERKADAEFRGPATERVMAAGAGGEPSDFDPLTYPAKLAELKSMTAKKGTPGDA